MIFAASFLVLVLGTIVDAQVETFPPAATIPDSTIVTTVVDGVVEEVVEPEFTCWNCQGGPLSYCGQASVTFATSCTGVNAQCYQAFIGYNRKALNLVVRGCWVPTTNVTNFCDSFAETNDPDLAELLACETCTGDLCNGSNTFYNTTGLYVDGACDQTQQL